MLTKYTRASSKLVLDKSFERLWDDFEFYLYVDEIYIYWKPGRLINSMQPLYPLIDFIKEKELVNGNYFIEDDDLVLLPNNKNLIMSYVKT